LSEPPRFAVRCTALTKKFYLYEHRSTTLREAFVRLTRREPVFRARPYFALTDVNLSVDRGEAVALIGPNGSGKSTALRVIAGIYPPSAGNVEIAGSVAAVLELGAGFHPDLSGIDNIMLYGTALGLSRRQVRDRLPAIAAFADIGEFLETPVKYYSSGMVARLAFSVAMSVEPDILLLDEVLAVGDQAFQAKCTERLRAFHAAGGTLILVSHDLSTVRDMCSRAIWLDHGQVQQEGPAKRIAAAYAASIARA
jgi:lipopolysaccharide transport system ATP-binding protein